MDSLAKLLSCFFLKSLSTLLIKAKTSLTFSVHQEQHGAKNNWSPFLLFYLIPYSS